MVVPVSYTHLHHGTGFAGFFYRKAKELGMEDIKEEDFRYPGPKPQSKEAAIVLLADSVQAAIHSMTVSYTHLDVYKRQLMYWI